MDYSRYYVVILFAILKSGWCENSKLDRNINKRLLIDSENVSERLLQLERKVQKYEALENQVQHLQATVHTLQSASTTGSVYTRWGRNECEQNNTELVYQGYAGGSWFNDVGGASNLVCLPSDPNLVHYRGTTPTISRGHLYGTEFEETLKAEHNQNVPCAVCRSKFTTSTTMIPARTACYPGWKQEYYGFLATGRADYKAHINYICVDNNPTFVPGGDANQDGALLFIVTAQCGSLLCPPYHQDTPIACVVCSK